MTWVAVLFPALFALGAGGLTWLLARFGWLAAARGAVLAMVILVFWLAWDWVAEPGTAGIGPLVPVLVMILPALAGAAIGLIAGQRARARRRQ